MITLPITCKTLGHSLGIISLIMAIIVTPFTIFNFLNLFTIPFTFLWGIAGAYLVILLMESKYRFPPFPIRCKCDKE